MENAKNKVDPSKHSEGELENLKMISQSFNPSSL